MSSPEIGHERRQSSFYNRHTPPTPTPVAGQKDSTTTTPSAGTTAAGEQQVRTASTEALSHRSSSNQRLLVLLSNLRTDPFCWLCHSTVGEAAAVRCQQCRRLFHKPCWTSHRSDRLIVTTITDGRSSAGPSLADSCLECLAIADENARPDHVLARVGSAKFKNFFLYMLHFVEEKLEKENAGPFAKSKRHPADCDEALCPAAFLRLKQKVADGQYTTYAQFLADLRGLVHKSIVIHGEDSGYSKAANYVLESCMQLCNSMDWCEECFERSLPRPGESIIAAILRSLVNPCSKLHVVVCIKMMGKMWPALVYRYDGEFVNVRFFGTLEFGRVHKSSVFLLYEEFELNLPSGQSQRIGTDAAYEHALRQCRLHIAKLLLIPECSVEFFPKVTPYDGRLFMKIHSIQSLLTKSPSRTESPNAPRGGKRTASGQVKSANDRGFDSTTTAPTGAPASAEKSKRHMASISLPSNPLLSETPVKARSDLQLNAVMQQKRQDSLRSNGEQPLNGSRPVMDSRSRSPKPPRDQSTGREASFSTRELDDRMTNRYFSSGFLPGSFGGLADSQGRQLATGAGRGGGEPANFPHPPTHHQSSRKSAEPKRFPHHVHEPPAKKTFISDGNQRGFPAVTLKTCLTGLQQTPSVLSGSRQDLSGTRRDELPGKKPNPGWSGRASPLPEKEMGVKIPSRSEMVGGETVERHGSPAVRSASGLAGSLAVSEDVLEIESDAVAPLVIDNDYSTERSAANPDREVKMLQTLTPMPTVEQRISQPVGPVNVQKQLVELFREMATAADSQQILMDKVQQEIAAAGRECIRQFAETQEKLETMCQDQLKHSQKMFGAASRQMQAIAEYVTANERKNSTDVEAVAYKRGRQDALRNRANWIDKTKQSFWCCVCRNQAHLLCCGVTLYCNEECQSSDYSSHRDHCRRLLPAGFEDTVIQTPYGDLTICQTFPHSDDLNNTPSPQDEGDQMQLPVDTSPLSSRHYEVADQDQPASSPSEDAMTSRDSTGSFPQ